MRKYPLLQSTIDRVLAAVSEDEPRTAQQVADIAGRSRKTIHPLVAAMYAQGLLGREPGAPLDGGGYEYLYRALPPDVEGVPLFDRHPGLDALPLARCLDLYTFRKKCDTIPHATTTTNISN